MTQREKKKADHAKWIAANPDRKKAHDAKYRAANAEKRRAYQLMRDFGITPAQYDAMLARQGGVCVICGRPPKVGGRRLDVEHDHKTKRVRGLACHKCNRLRIGNNTAETARLLLTYLESDFDGRAI